MHLVHILIKLRINGGMNLDTKKNTKVINIPQYKKAKNKKKSEKGKNNKSNSNQFKHTNNYFNWSHGPGDDPSINP